MNDLTETKANLKKLLTEINYDTKVNSVLKNFIDTYDGTNTTEFETTMYLVTLFLLRMHELELKSKAFDKIKVSNDRFNNAFKKIKINFERISHQELPYSMPDAKLKP